MKVLTEYSGPDYSGIFFLKGFLDEKNNREGKWTWFLTDGTIEKTGFYKNGEVKGLWEYFSYKGNLISKIFHI